MDFTSLTFASILSLAAMTEGISVKATPQVAQINTYTLPSITGQWQLDLKTKLPGCQERYNFARDEKFVGSSGQEFTFGRYLYSSASEGLPALVIQTEHDNNAVDCSGNQVDQTGDMLMTFVKQEGNVMHWCKDPAGKQCEMTMHRVLP